MGAPIPALWVLLVGGQVADPPADPPSGGDGVANPAWQPPSPPLDEEPAKKNWKTGYDDGFYIRSPDRNFKLKLTGHLQLRYVLNRRLDDDEMDIRHDFQIRRAKLKARGYVIGPWLDYAVQVAYDDARARLELQYAWGRLEMTDDLSLKVGRFRPPLLREEEVSSKRQLAAERSVIATRFRQKRTGGAELIYELKKVRIRGAFFQSTNDVFTTDAWFLSARAAGLLVGKWKRLRDFTSFPGQKSAVALGAGILYGYEDRDDPANPDSQLLRWTTDVSVELGGAHAFAAIVGNHVNEEGQPALDQYGVVVQGGVFLGKGFELFTRYELGDADEVAPDLSTITFGLNGYFNEHRIKFTADVGYGLQEVADFWSFRTATGWRTDDAGLNGQIVFRAQFQLLF